MVMMVEVIMMVMMVVVIMMVMIAEVVMMMVIDGVGGGGDVDKDCSCTGNLSLLSDGCP